ncbi:MAG: fused MFS/spermidine synthase [Actinomycetota bacterium]|nr:fused MFS/spermidine synthase [Actinomycetota bacterium]
MSTQPAPPVAPEEPSARRRRRDVPPTATAARRHVIGVGLAVFTSGAVLLGLEITASRVLAPFFGNSLFVWGALIGVVLAGLSIGYWAGGVLADRIPAPLLLVGVMALSGLLVLAIPLVDDPVLEAIVGWDPGPRLNPLVAAIALFGLPSIVFAAVTPIAVRLLTRSLATVGRTAGRLFAISTAGSIAGTFATAFFLIPEFGTNQLLAQSAAAMFVAIGLVALVERMPVVLVAALLAAGGAGVASVQLAPESGGTLAGAAARNWSPVYRLRGDVGAAADYRAEGYDVVLAKDTRYHRLAVVEDDDTRYLRFDNSFQSAMYLNRPFATRFEYTDYFHLGLAYNPRARNVLFIGLGGGSAPKRLWRDFPRLRIQVVELDPVVVDVARRYFRLPRSPRLRVEAEDGRRFLAADDRRWDVIAIDAYFSDAIPFHLATHEFLELVRSRLNPGGVVVSNVIGAIRGSESQLFRSFYRTYRSVFPTVLVHPVAYPGETDEALRNIMVVAGEGAAPEKPFLLARWRALRERFESAPNLRKAILNRRDFFIPTGDVPTLTDDYAPTDALLVVE